MREALRRSDARQVTRTHTFPAPRRGWIRNENLAKPKAEGASVLDNWFPTATGCRARRGSLRYATAGSGPVRALMAYQAGNLAKLFAANATSIYDITTVIDPNTSPSLVVAGLTSGDWAYTQFATPGTTVLVAVNGSDVPQLYSGSGWSTSPAVTFPAGTGPMSHVWSFKKRLFYIEKNTLNAWYLPVATIGGTAVVFPLAGVFKQGGSLLFGATWSYASTGTGMTDACIFVTDQGEVALYEGDDPSMTTGWALRGVYRIGRPIGKNASFKAGGDLAIATDAGLIAMSQALVSDPAALAAKALSYAIEEDWKSASLLRRTTASWQTVLWPAQQMAITAMPAPDGSDPFCFVTNIRTGAWARYTGWDPQCIGLLGDRLFFGTKDGHVVEAEVGGSDNGAIYTATYIGLFEDLGSAAIFKDCDMARATVVTTAPTNLKVSVSTDFTPKLPAAPSSASAAGLGNLWNVGLWNQAQWSAPIVKIREAEWMSVTGGGIAIAPNVQISLGSVAAPTIDLVQVDLQYQPGQALA